MTEYPAPTLAANLRRMIRNTSRLTLESVARFQTRDGEFANFLYYSEDEYNSILDWITDPAGVGTFRDNLTIVGQTKTRVGVAYAPTN